MFAPSSYTVLVLLLFFFKQKTAYEMLISDWSSDVCSSDLLRKAREEDVEPLLLSWSDPDMTRYSGLRPNIRQFLAGMIADMQRKNPEIGRASSRERVCQYV